MPWDVYSFDGFVMMLGTANSISEWYTGVCNLKQFLDRGITLE